MNSLLTIYYKKCYPTFKYAGNILLLCVSCSDYFSLIGTNSNIHFPSSSIFL